MNSIITIPRLLLVPALLFAAMFTSCKDNSSSMTRFNVKMTDAPGEYDAVNISVKEVQVLTSEGTSVLEVESQEPFDILKYRMGKDILIASEDIPAGYIQEIRLVLNETGNDVVIDGQTFPMTTPSGQTAGVKLKVHEELTAGVAYTMTLDFDVAKSVVQTGNGKYILKPVIRAIPQAVSGALTGVIDPAASKATVWARIGVDSTSAIADPTTGKFFFAGLDSGTYTLRVVPVSPYLPKTLQGNVVVTKGSVKDVGTITVTQ
jgi:hypothetical protein